MRVEYLFIFFLRAHYYYFLIFFFTRRPAAATAIPKPILSSLVVGFVENYFNGIKIPKPKT